MQAAVYAMMLLDQEVAMSKAAEGAPCAVNDDCESAWCNMWAIPHVCGGDEVTAKAAEGESCVTNDDCESAWCNMWAIPHVCGGDEKNAEGDACTTNADCESY